MTKQERIPHGRPLHMLFYSRTGQVLGSKVLYTFDTLFWVLTGRTEVSDLQSAETFLGRQTPMILRSCIARVAGCKRSEGKLLMGSSQSVIWLPKVTTPRISDLVVEGHYSMER